MTGPVTGFVLPGDGLPTVYVSGDDAALEHVGAVADRFGPVDVAILFTGAAWAAQAAVVLGARRVLPLAWRLRGA